LYHAEQPARMSWSRNCRLFYGESEYGAYLPVKDVIYAIINEIGYDGWVSMELFNRVMGREDHEVVEELATRAATSWQRLQTDMGLIFEVLQDPLRSGKATQRVQSGVGYRIAEAGLARL
jgi:4-hydroxyphenylpyruvate dioxygenase